MMIAAAGLAFAGDDSKSTLIHAFLLAILAMLASHTDDSAADGSLLPDAAEALGMTTDAFHAKLQQYL